MRVSVPAPASKTTAATAATAARLQRCSCGQASKPEECPECRRKAALQRAAAGGAGEDGRDGPALAPPVVHDVLRSPGQPLDAGVRATMENGFGHDFGAVRVHHDARAAGSARAVNALAYTVGQHVVFAPGTYNPATNPGRRLIAHELAHTIQQGAAGQAGGLQARLEVAPVDDPLEAEADRLAASALSGTAAGGAAAPGAQAPISTPSTPSRLRVHRDPPTAGTPPPTPPPRVVYIDANVIDQISRGNVPAATQLKQLLSQGVEVRIGQQAYNEMVHNPGIPRTGAANKLLLDELGIKLGPKTAMADRVGALDANITTSRSGSPILSEPDAAVLAEVKAAGRQAEIWSFDKAFRTNPQNIESTFGVKVAPESTTIAPVQSGAPDYRVARQNMGLKPVEIGLNGEVKPTAPVPGEKPPGAAKPGANETPPPSAPVRVQAEFKITSSTPQANGNILTEVEVVLKGSLDELNKLGGGKSIPAKIVMRITHTADGALVAAEGLAGESAGLVNTLARQALATAPGAGGAETGAAAGVAAGAKAVPKWVKGVGWGGTILFVAVTGYQLGTATPEERPRVATTAAGGFAAGTISSYVVCNVIFGIETFGLSLIGCALVAGGIGGYVGSEVAGAGYDKALESALTPLERSLRDLQKAPGNAQKLFHAMVSKSGTGLAINETFVKQFMGIVPADLTDAELSALVAGLTSVSSGDTLTGVLNKLHSAILNLPGRKPVSLEILRQGMRDQGLFPILPVGNDTIRLLPQPALTPFLDPLPGGPLGKAPAPTQPLLEFRFDLSNIKPPGKR